MEKSEYSTDLLDEWISIFAKALFSDKELIQNVLAEIAAYDRRDHNINMPISALANSYFKQLESSQFAAKNIENELKQNDCVVRTNKDIVLESIRNSHVL